MTIILGPFNYGSNPQFTLTFQQLQEDGVTWANADPTGPVEVNLSDEFGGTYAPTVTHFAQGQYRFYAPGGLMKSGIWSGRGFDITNPGQTSCDFMFMVPPTSNP